MDIIVQRKISVTDGQICATLKVKDAKKLVKELQDAIKRVQKSGYGQDASIYDTDKWRRLSIGIIK